MKTEHQPLDTIPEIFLFVNSASGGGIGREILNLKVQELHLEVSASQNPSYSNHIVTATLHIFDMKSDDQRKQGFRMLSQFVAEKKKVLLVICGGDGTVMWVVTELHTFEIDHSKVPIAMLPLGTGNDFSQILGWGKQCPSDILQDNFKELKKMITYWFSGFEDNLDIWMIEAEVQQYGKFQKVQNSQTRVLEDKVFIKHWCNYFSIGIDGKIGYSFDLHRTSSRLGNLAVYGAMGFVKSFTKTKTVGDLTNRLSEYSRAPIRLKDDKPRKVILQKETQPLREVKNNENMLFLNIDSYMGGVKDIWKNASLTSSIKESEITLQSFSDGKLEVMSFGGAWSLGFEKSFGGLADKIYQGSGPFLMEFNEFPPNEKHRTYLQVDGEYIRYTHPKQLIVQKSTLSKTGQIRVLRRVPLQSQKTCCCC